MKLQKMIKPLLYTAALSTLLSCAVAQNVCNYLKPGTQWKPHSGNMVVYGACMYFDVNMTMTDSSTLSLQLTNGKPYNPPGSTSTAINCPDIRSSVTNITCEPEINPHNDYWGDVHGSALYDSGALPISGNIFYTADRGKPPYLEMSYTQNSKIIIGLAGYLVQ